jgi:small-conductance mechanosensitive channel
MEWFPFSIAAIQILLVSILAFVIIVIVNRLFRRSQQEKQEKAATPKPLFHENVIKPHLPHSLHLSETRHRILKRLIQVFIFLVALGIIIYLIPPLRALSYSMLAGAGIAAVIIGFAVQKSFANIFAGLFIGIYEPFRIGDYIKIGEQSGTVEDITLHHTVIREWRNIRYVIPNSIISEETIENFTLSTPKVFHTFEIGISYDSDVDLARKIILEEVNKHEEVISPEEKVDGKIVAQEPNVKVIDWGESSIRLRVGFWVNHPFLGWRVKFDVLENVKKRFAKEGVEIPYPYRTLVYKKDMRPTRSMPAKPAHRRKKAGSKKKSVKKSSRHRASGTKKKKR